jgi:hypothetical protein
LVNQNEEMVMVFSQEALDRLTGDASRPGSALTPEQEAEEERIGRQRLKERSARTQSAPPSIRPPPAQTPEQIYQDILDNILRNNPKLTREEAQAMLAHYV